jgi:hypothetical protein
MLFAALYYTRNGPNWPKNEHYGENGLHGGEKSLKGAITEEKGMS